MLRSDPREEVHLKAQLSRPTFISPTRGHPPAHRHLSSSSPWLRPACLQKQKPCQGSMSTVTGAREHGVSHHFKCLKLNTDKLSFRTLLPFLLALRHSTVSARAYYMPAWGTEAQDNGCCLLCSQPRGKGSVHTHMLTTAPSAAMEWGHLTQPREEAS